MKKINRSLDQIKDFFAPASDIHRRREAKIVALLLLVLFAGAFWAAFPEFFFADGILLKKKFVVFAGGMLFAGMLIAFKNPFSERVNIAINSALLVGMPFVAFAMVEFIMRIADLWKLDLKFVLLNVFLYMVIMYGVFVLTFSVALAMDVMMIAAYIFAVANVYLVRFRQIPLMVSDLSVAATAANVSQGYSYDPTMGMLAGAIVLVDVLLLSLRLKRNKGLAREYVMRFSLICGYSVFLLAFIWLSFRNDSQFLKDHASINTFRPIKSYHKHGGMLTFYSSTRLMLVKKPDGYSPESVDKIAAKYKSDSIKNIDKKDMPNVIVILDEAFNNLGTLGELETNQPVTPFYDSLDKNALKGTAYVSVFGGQTANTEFEFLTGDTKAFLPSGSTPFQLFIKDYVPSLTGDMKNIGARGMLAMHPFKASGYNRVAVYDHLGFSRFIVDEDFPEDAEIIRDLISDREDFKRIIQEYEASEKDDPDAPFYLYNVTMQSHSPYDRVWDNLDRAIKIKDKNLDDKEAEQYLDCMHESDKAFKLLVDYFSKTDDKTVICFWGDHMPGLSDSFYEKLIGKSPDSLSDEEAMSLYTIPFVIWANYDIDDEPLDNAISMSYLKSLMLQRCGMPMTGYDKFLLDFSKDVPAINGHGYFGADGKFYELNDEKSPYYKRLSEYNQLTYNHLFDGDNRNEFFEYDK